MSKYEVGDTVVIGEVYWNRHWIGCQAKVVRIIREDRYEVMVDGPPAVNGRQGFLSDHEIVRKVEFYTLEDLLNVLDSLRDQGYDIDPVKITAPPAQFTL